MPTPAKDSRSSATRILAIASSFTARVKIAESERSPAFTRALIAALTWREAVDLANAADLCAGVNCGGVGISKSLVTKNFASNRCSFIAQRLWTLAPC